MNQAGHSLKAAACNLRVGVDLVEVARIAALLEHYGQRFSQRVFTADELSSCAGRVASLAARWAAKEAVAKALGTGLGPIGFREIEVVQDASGRPAVRLSGRAQALAEAQGLNCWAISLTHDAGMALAFVVGQGVSLP